MYMPDWFWWIIRTLAFVAENWQTIVAGIIVLAGLFWWYR